MNKDQIIGATRHLRGEVQEAFGKVLGMETLQFRGRLNKITGRALRDLGDSRQLIKLAVKNSQF